MFRIQYKTFGLTYSKCNAERKEIVEFLQTKLQIVDYYCVRESHDSKKENYDPARPHHIHVWFNVDTKPNIKNPRFFDYNGIHPNIGKKKRNWIYNYLQKQDKQPYTNIPEGFIGLALAGDYDGAVRRFQDLHPKEFVINMPKVLGNLKKLSRPAHKMHVYPLECDYDPQWNPAEKSLHLVGASGCGKTEWVKSYLHSIGKTFLYVTHLDTLKRYNGEDILVFDDMSFQHIPREAAIHLVECKNPRAIHCRHAVADIPPGVGNVFISNSPHIWPHDEHGAIERRLLVRAPLIRFFKGAFGAQPEKGSLGESPPTSTGGPTNALLY